MTATRRLYGKCHGNGPWHLLVTEDGRARCGRPARYHGKQLPWPARERDICSKCRTAERAAEQPEGSDRG